MSGLLLFLAWLQAPLVDELPLIIPTPKHVTLSTGQVHVNASTKIVCGSPRMTRKAAEAVQREVVRLGGPKLTIQTSLPIDLSNCIVLGEPGNWPALRHALRRLDLDPPRNRQGYVIKVGGAYGPAAIVAGSSSAGTFHGAQSLCQLLRMTPKGVKASKLKVWDYPSLEWRGAHLFLGNTALPFHKKLITNVLARFKFNHLVLQCEQADWDTLGEAAPEWAMSKSDLRKELAYAREHGLTVIPLVNSVGHAQWLVGHPRFGDLAEDPDVPYAVAPGNPRSYRVLRSLYREVLNEFPLPVLHIGGDEVRLRARYPFRSKDKYPRLSDAYLAHVTRLASHLRARGVRTMIWSDQLLSREEVSHAATAPSLAEAQFVRSRLPRDIELVDWHYTTKDIDKRLEILGAAGFRQVIGATWRNANNIHLFSKALADRGHKGLLQTTWVGYNSQEANLKSAPENFVSFVIAAEQAWNGGAVRPDRIGYDAARVFEKAYALPLN